MKKHSLSYGLTIAIGILLTAAVLLPMLLSKQTDSSIHYHPAQKVPDHGRIWPEH